MGYINYSMSERAAQAYESGLKPLSKWTKSEIIENVVEFGAWSEGELKKYPKAILVECFLVYAEWHHTGKLYNETMFWGINEDTASVHATEMIEGRFRLYKESLVARKRITPKETVTKAYIEFEQWEGSRKYGSFVKHAEYALLAGGNAYLLHGFKKMTGSHILWVKKFQRAPRGTAKIFAGIQKNLPAKYRR